MYRKLICDQTFLVSWEDLFDIEYVERHKTNAELRVYDGRMERTFFFKATQGVFEEPIMQEY